MFSKIFQLFLRPLDQYVAKVIKLDDVEMITALVKAGELTSMGSEVLEVGYGTSDAATGLQLGQTETR